jgi:pimeloyl-ACP methyl ester carboxylesterase
MDRYDAAMPAIHVNGVACYHEDVGTGEPVLLLHGGFCSIETMRAQIEALSQRYRVLAPERPGHGRSPDREGPVSFDGIVSDTVAYLDALGIDRAHVVGFSDGAIAGYLLALRHPRRIRSLVAISGNLNPSVTVPPEQMARAMPEAVVTALTNDYDRLSPDGPEHREKILAKLMRMWHEEPDIDPAELAAVAAPTLIMAGDHDGIPTDHTILICSSIPDAQLCIVPNASHMLMLDRPDLVNLILVEFLATLPGSLTELGTTATTSG